MDGTLSVTVFKQPDLTFMTYDLKSLKLPRLGNRALNSAVTLLESPYTRRLLEPLIVRETGLERLRKLELSEPPCFAPIAAPGRAPAPASAAASLKVLEQLPEADNNPQASIADFARAYRQGLMTPTEVAEQVIEAIAASNAGAQPLHAVIASMDQDIRRQAQESQARFESGKPLGLLDGVPVAVKDELDCIPYTTTAGTAIYGQDGSAEADATVVSRLRAQGAIVIGKTNMHEIGIGVTGSNIHYGHARNPHQPGHYTGGSSSGSAAAVAAGICPLALAADGGGSVRIPAALCGVPGLKPTYGRVSEHGAFPLCWSVAHIGPIGTCVDDVAIAYSIMAGLDPLDPNTLQQPPLHLSDYLNAKLDGVRIGIYNPWFSHASRPLVQNAQLAIEHLKQMGAEVVDIEVPELECQRIAHAVTISSEMLTAVLKEYREQASSFAADTRMALAIANYFNNVDYLKSQRMRQRAINLYKEIFQSVDIILTPSTGILAPRIRARDDESCEASMATLTDLMRFCFPANLAGLPALTLPSGYSDEDLPTGVQLMAAHWQEHLLLRVGRALENHMERRQPRVHYRILKGK